MPAAPKTHREQPDELDSALQAISEKWQGNLAAYLTALARAKENNLEILEDRHLYVRSTAGFSRSSKR